MGITIHYKGRIKDSALIPQIQDEFADIAKSLKWKYNLWNEDLNKPMDVTIEQTDKGTHVEGHVPLKGITIQVEPKVETLDILFNAEGDMTSFIAQIFETNEDRRKRERWVHVKTQFGSVAAHIVIVKLLQYLKKKFVPNLVVRDEGEYWETGDKNRLLELRGFLFRKINQLSNAFSQARTDEELSKDELIAKIESIIKQYLEKGDKN